MKNLNLTREEVAATIQEFLDGSGGWWDWDDFLSSPIANPELEEIRRRCNLLSEDFPATEAGRYCSPKGLDVLKSYLSALRGQSA